MTVDEDIEAFEDALADLHEELQRYPFHFGNENLLVPELYARLRPALAPPTVELEYRQDHSDLDQWRNRELFDRTDKDQEVPRVRPEVRFYGDGALWRGTKRDYDLAVFAADGPAVMQGKREGIGNFVDVDSDLSVLVELKHSMNMSGRFRTGGETDVTALGEFPGSVGGRYFVFVDWWPFDGYGDPTFESDLRSLAQRLPELDHTVDIGYLPRGDDIRFVRSVGD